MADYRTKPETELTFYAYSQPDGKFNISRYDTLDEAVNKFNEDKDLSSFSGIGISKNGRSELDIVHKRDTTPVLVTDYTKVEAFKCDREAREAIKDVVRKLGIVWEYNNSIFNNSALSSLCIPCSIGNENILHNEYVENLSLKASTPNNTVSSIEQMFISDKGEWLSLKEVMHLCRNGEHPKIESIDVNVLDNSKKENGIITVSPQDYILISDNYLLSHQKGFPMYEIESAFEHLAGDLNDFMFDYDFYHYTDNLPADGELEAIKNIAEVLKKGNVEPIIKQLSSIIEEGNIERDQIFRAKELISRVKIVGSEHTYNHDLESKIKNAEISNTNVKSKIKIQKPDRNDR